MAHLVQAWLLYQLLSTQERRANPYKKSWFMICLLGRAIDRCCTKQVIGQALAARG
jgi:hypothetical protein